MVNKGGLGWSAAARGLTALALVAATVGSTPEGPVPWPEGRPPSVEAVDAMIADMNTIFERGRLDELNEAEEPGEESEGIFVFQEWIDEGQFDIERIFQFGDEVFEHEYRPLDGFGDPDTVDGGIRRVHAGVYGGLDAYSCNACHAQGGINGAGSATALAFYSGDGDHASSALVRSPPAVIGLGVVQALGFEMSAELAFFRQEAIDEAATTGNPVTKELVTKGVSFGSLVASPDGSVDTSGVEGVDADLVVKPFGWKGHTARLRRFAEEAARRHFGIQSHVLALEYQTDPDEELLGPGPNWFDPDNDGKTREIEEGSITAVAVYLAMLESPIVLPPYDETLRHRWGRGSALFDEIGCANCHVRTLELHNPVWIEEPDTTGGAGVELNLLLDGEQPRSEQQVAILSDLKRHDMGPALADPYDNPFGVAREVYLTRPLWGLAETGPYLHDGRAATIVDAIVAHDGEAADARAAFVKLPDESQQDIHLYLLSLTRTPRLRLSR